MTQWLELFLYTFTIILTLLTFIVTIFRRPFSSTKVTFGIFGVALILWNIIRIVLLTVSNVEYIGILELFSSVLSILTLYFSVLFALHFPFYRRREVKLSYFTSFIAGMGYLVLLQTVCVPLVQMHFPIETRFYMNIHQFLLRAFLLLCILSFVVTIFYKLTKSIPALKLFMYRSFLLMGILTVVTIGYNYLVSSNYNFFSAELKVDYVDLVYITIILFSIYQFQYFQHYPGPLSIFITGENTNLVIEKMASANMEGASLLKDHLWRMYEVESWHTFIDEFWFNILIDETIDNALEHGGKRANDIITVQVFESSKYLDFYVSDKGKGFDPSDIPDPRTPDRKAIPTGRGLLILQKLFRTSWNFLGNEIRVRVNKASQELLFR